MKVALNIHDAQIKGTLGMANGFQSEGAILMDNATIIGRLHLLGSRASSTRTTIPSLGASIRHFTRCPSE